MRHVCKINEDKIAGKTWTITKICNISSVPPWALSQVTNRFSDSASQITSLALQTQMHIDEVRMKRMHKKTYEKQGNIYC